MNRGIFAMSGLNTQNTCMSITFALRSMRSSWIQSVSALNFSLQLEASRCMWANDCRQITNVRMIIYDSYLKLSLLFSEYKL